MPNISAKRFVLIPSFTLKIHIVDFKGHQIQQVRLYWDQGSLLKLVDVIGSRGKNWPIRDGKDQARLIASSAATTTSQGNGVTPSTSTSNPGNPNEAVVTSDPAEQRKNVTGDPHASLSLFGPRSDDSAHVPKATAPRGSAKPPPRDYHDLFVSEGSPDASAQASQKENRPRAQSQKAQSAKPPPRDYHDLFIGNDSDASPAAKERPASPQKSGQVAPKGGAGKNYHPSRLFDMDDTPPGTPKSPSKDTYIKPHPTKFKHFEMGGDNEESSKQQSPAKPRVKPQSQLDIGEYLNATEKPIKNPRNQEIRHFGWGDDDTNVESPVKHPNVAHARPDAKASFDFQDDGTPGDNRRPAGHPRGKGVNNGLGLYQNNLFDDTELPPIPPKNRPLSTVTNLKGRSKDFDPKWGLADAQPTLTDRTKENKPVSPLKPKSTKPTKPQPEDDDEEFQHFAPPKSTAQTSGDSRPASRDQENLTSTRNTDRPMGIKNGGDGMGGAKGSVRSWGFGDESDEDGVGGSNSGKFMAGKKQQAPKESSGFWDY